MVESDLLDYKDDTSSPATNMLETKILFNSVISNSAEGARFISIHLKDMFLMTLTAKPKYMKVPFK